MKAKDVLRYLGISRVTLSDYVKQGKIRVTKLHNGRYEYNDEDIYKLLPKQINTKHVAYARVSSHAQKEDLNRQVHLLEKYCNTKGIKLDEVITDIKTGLHLDRPGFNKLLDMVLNKEVSIVYITYKDRLARLSYELVDRLFSKYGTRIEVLSANEMSFQEELFQDLMALIHSFSMKFYSKRKYLLNKICKGSENGGD